jgi:hypothetical protein
VSRALKRRGEVAMRYTESGVEGTGETKTRPATGTGQWDINSSSTGVLFPVFFLFLVWTALHCTAQVRLGSRSS